MTLTFEQFQELRKKGLTPQQIAKFESGFKPKETGGLGEFFRGVGTGILSSARELSSGAKTLTDKAPTVGMANPAFKALGALSPTLKKGEELLGAEEGALTSVPESTAGKAGFYTEKVAEFLTPEGVETSAKALKKPLTALAEKLYQSALKPRDVVKGGKVVKTAEDIAKIGLDEKVWLTKGGVERVANRIDDFESKLGDAIEAAKKQGIKIKTEGLQSYLDEAKKFFDNQIDVKAADKAIEEIDAIGKNFLKKYGKEIPIEKAQEIKVATGKALRKYYDKLSSAGIEGSKQATRFLKEQIVENAPVVKDVNKRLSNLYQFDQALSKASGRIGNLNLLGLGVKFGAGAGGVKGAIIGKIVDLMDAPAIKSGAGITLNELSKISSKGAIPLNAVLGLIRAKIEELTD